MKRLLLLILSFGLIPSAQARVVYITNFGRIHIEERCQDGKPDHQVWHMDVRGEIQKLNLKGQGDEYFKNPELIPSDTYKSEKGYIESKEIHKRAKEESSKEVSTTLIREEAGNQLAFLDNN